MTETRSWLITDVLDIASTLCHNAGALILTWKLNKTKNLKVYVKYIFAKGSFTYSDEFRCSLFWSVWFYFIIWYFKNVINRFDWVIDVSSMWRMTSLVLDGSRRNPIYFGFTYCQERLILPLCCTVLRDN